MLAYQDIADMSLLSRAAALIAESPAPYAGDWSAELTLAAHGIEFGETPARELLGFARCVVLTSERRTS